MTLRKRRQYLTTNQSIPLIKKEILIWVPVRSILTSKSLTRLIIIRNYQHKSSLE